MAAAFDAGSIFVNLRSRTRQFVEGFRQARTVAKRFFAAIRRGGATITRAGKSMRQFGQTLLTKVTLPLTIAFGLILRSIDKQAKAQAQLNAVIKSTGAAAGVTAAHVEALAASIQKVSRVGDEVVIRGAAILLTFTSIKNAGDGMNAVFDRTTRLAVDMAAALDTDLKQSMIQVGKAINDPLVGMSALQRVGVSFTKQQKEQVKALIETNNLLDAQKLILDELEKEFSGVAASLATKGIGPLVQGINDMGDAFESLGVVLAPVITQVGAWISQLAAWLKGLPDTRKRLLLIIAALLAALGPLIFSLGVLATLIGSVVVPGIVLIGTTLMATLGPIGLVAAAVGALTLLLTKQISKWIAGRRQIKRYAGDAKNMSKVLEAQGITLTKKNLIAVTKFSDAMREFRKFNIDGARAAEFGTKAYFEMGKAVDAAALAIGDAAKVSNELLDALGLKPGEIERFAEGARKAAEAAAPKLLEMKVELSPESIDRMEEQITAFAVGAADDMETLGGSGQAAISRMTGAIDKFGDRGREDLKKVIEEAGDLEEELRGVFRALMRAGPESYDVLKEAAEDLIQKLNELRAQLVLPPAVAPPKFTEAQEDLQRTAEAAGNTIGNAIVDGINQGKTALETLAALGRRLFESHMGLAISNLSKLASVEIAKVAGTSAKLVEGIINVALAAIGFILSQLDKGTETISNFQQQAAEVQSSQLVRGIVAGPQNVAIAEVNDSIASAFVPTEDRLDVLIGIGQEILLALTSGGGGGGPSSAGRTPT